MGIRCRLCEKGILDGKECHCCGGWWKECENCEREHRIAKWAYENFEKKSKADKVRKDDAKDK